MDPTPQVAGSRKYPTSDLARCPGCGHVLAGPPAVWLPLVAADVRRCDGCGDLAVSGADRRTLTLCRACDLPLPAHAGGICSACRVEETDPAPLDPDLVVATEHQVHESLAQQRVEVGSVETLAYVNRVLRSLAGRIAPCSGEIRAAIFHDEAVRTLALPSGTVLISTGTLGVVADEAELAFVLGRELTHIAGGDVAPRLIRVALRSAAARRTRGGQAWSDAACSLVRLGHGLRAEYEADRKAVSNLAVLGYDMEAATRFLERAFGACRTGDPAWADFAAAHPPVRERLHRIRLQVAAADAGARSGRVDREVFRRAAGRTALTPQTRRESRPERRSIGRIVLAVNRIPVLVGVAVLVLLISLAALLVMFPGAG